MQKSVINYNYNYKKPGVQMYAFVRACMYVFVHV